MEQRSVDVSERMRDDWNARAREDAHYYVAFGRREQSEEEFLATATPVLGDIEAELKRLPPGNPRARRALEIGCGPGRLMKPLARHFGEIHGVDVSDEMIRLARQRLRGIPHAHVHATNGSELAQFADDSFDLVYSYAVFQHIPSRDVVLEYFREIERVLKPGGVARLQMNGLPQTARVYDTWAGVRFSPEELTAFTREYDLQALALDGVSTQYMWTTWSKRDPGWRTRGPALAAQSGAMRVRRITNAYNTEPVAPNRGRYASVSIWVENLPDEVDLFDLQVLVGGLAARPTYIGTPDQHGLQQISAILSAGDLTGLVPVEMRWFGASLGHPAILRMIPAGPAVPRILSVSDGTNLLSFTRVETGTLKITLEEAERIEDFAVALDGRQVDELDRFCTDPLPCRWEVNVRLPDWVAAGPHLLEMRLGHRRFAPVRIDVTPVER